MEEREIDLVELFKVFKKDLIKNILIGFVLAAIVFAVSKFVITPKYQSSVSLIVNSEQNQNNNDTLQLNDIQLNQKLVSTYAEIIKTRGISDQVINNLGLDIDYESLTKMISVSTKDNTEIFVVSVEDTNPQRAADIANETSNVFKNSIVNIMKIDNVQILDKGLVADNPSSPNIMRNTAMGFVLGFVLGVFITIIKLLTDTTVKSAEDITESFGLPVIGIIPDRKN